MKASFNSSGDIVYINSAGSPEKNAYYGTRTANKSFVTNSARDLLTGVSAMARNSSNELRGMSNLPLFMQYAINLEKASDVRLALDTMYDQFNELLLNNRWSLIDYITRLLSPSYCPKNVILTVLTLTYRCRHKVPSRELLFKAFRSFLEEKGEDAHSILYGLEGR